MGGAISKEHAHNSVRRDSEEVTDQEKEPDDLKPARVSEFVEQIVHVLCVGRNMSYM